MDADMAKNEPLKLADDEVDFWKEWKEGFLTQLRYLVNRPPWVAAFTFSSPGDPAELADLCVRDLRRRR